MSFRVLAALAAAAALVPLGAVAASAQPAPVSTGVAPEGTWETLKVDEARGLLAGVSVGPAEHVLSFDVYDISEDCAHPKLLNSSPGLTAIDVADRPSRRSPLPQVRQLGQVLRGGPASVGQHTIPVTFDGIPHLVAVDEFAGESVQQRHPELVVIDEPRRRGAVVGGQLRLRAGTEDDAGAGVPDVERRVRPGRDRSPRTGRADGPTRAHRLAHRHRARRGVEASQLPEIGRMRGFLKGGTAMTREAAQRATVPAVNQIAAEMMFHQTEETQAILRLLATAGSPPAGP